MSVRTASQNLSMKRCARCRTTKPTTAFGKRSGRRDGLHPYCHDCAREANRETRRKHGPRYNAARTAKLAADPMAAEAHRAASRAWHHANPEKAKERGRRWRRANPDRRRELLQRWRDENRELVRAANRAAHHRAPHKTRARVATRRARRQAAFVEVVDPLVVWQAHGGCCGICHDFVPFDDMHVDHVIPLARGGEHSYANTQPAHPFCNLSKGAR